MSNIFNNDPPPPPPTPELDDQQDSVVRQEQEERKKIAARSKARRNRQYGFNQFMTQRSTGSRLGNQPLTNETLGPSAGRNPRNVG